MVEEDVAFGPENLGLPRDEVRRRVEASLDAVEVADLRLRPPHQLSGGQKQRVAIAGVLAMQPRCIVLDESTAMLDPEGRREVLAVVRRLHQAGTTIVLVTHFMSEAALAERIVVLAEGRIELDGSPREVFGKRDRLRELDLDVPPVTAVAERGRAAGIAISGLPLTIEEFVAALP
jgi:energy-coupling factor transport system ATP-binding protein